MVTDTRIRRSRSQPTGISGLADRICCRVKPASSAAPAMSSVSVHESVHGWRTARANPATARTRPAVTRAAPGTSILLPDASADSGTPARVRTAASTAIGTLTQNTACQPECSTSSPPASGPMASPRPDDTGPYPDDHGQFTAAEDLGQQRQRQRGQQRRAGTLHRPGSDQHRRTGGKAARGRPGGEQQQAGHEHLAPAEAVAELAAEQDQSREGHDIGVDGPFELVRRGTQVVLDRRDRDVDDGVVQEDREQGQAGGGECQRPRPAARSRLSGGRCLRGTG